MWTKNNIENVKSKAYISLRSSGRKKKSLIESEKKLWYANNREQNERMSNIFVVVVSVNSHWEQKTAVRRKRKKGEEGKSKWKKSEAEKQLIAQASLFLLYHRVWFIVYWNADYQCEVGSCINHVDSFIYDQFIHACYLLICLSFFRFLLYFFRSRWAKLRSI